MAHHAYFFAGEPEQGIRACSTYASSALGISEAGSPDYILLRYTLLSIDDARALTQIAFQKAIQGEHKMIVVVAGRIFPPAQNALLKLFEEPPPATTLVLIVPSEGVLLDTLRSRLLPLPLNEKRVVNTEAAKAFLYLSKEERAKAVTKLVERTRSDNDTEKQEARIEARVLLEQLLYVARTHTDDEARAFVADLVRFAPLMHDASAPIKLIFEHILIVLPASLTKKI